ncbi:MAG: hypothetical protein ABI811_05995, partial [Acidobacteriota bacterium]
YTVIATPSGTTFVNTGLTNGTTYFYVVSGINAGGEGANSTEVSGQPVAPPAAPAGLTATPGNGQVSLSWAAVGGATNYNVKRATVSGGPYTVIATPAGSTFVNSGLTNSITYFYVVSAVNTSGEGADSGQVSGLPIAAPAAPTGLTAVPGNGQVSLSWAAVGGATSYNVKRATLSGGPYTVIATPSGTTFVNTGLTNGTTYFYVVSGINAIGEGANSAQVSASPVAPPLAPTGLTATLGNGQISLSWTAVANAVSYNVKRSTTTGGPFTTIANVATPTFVNDTLTNGTAYFYVVSSLNSLGEGSNSSELGATPSATGTPFITGLNGNALRNDFSGWVGMKLTIGPDPLAVGSVGRMCAPGNSGTHQVKFVNAATGADVPGTPIAVNMAGCVVGQFVYRTLASPIALGSGNSYYLASLEVQGSDRWYEHQVPIKTLVASVNASYSSNGTSWVVLPSPDTYVPVNFTYIGGPNVTGALLTGSSGTVLRNNSNGWVGMKLTIGTAAKTVSSLGRYCAAGSTGLHIVKLVNATTGEDLAGGAASLSLSGCVAGQFLYSSLPNSISLAAGASYYLVSQEFNGGDRWYDFAAVTTLGGTASAVYSENGSGWTVLPIGSNMAYGPLNLK